MSAGWLASSGELPQVVSLQGEPGAILWDRLRASNFEGDERDLLEVELVRYAIAKYPGRIRGGRVFKEVARLGRGVDRPAWLTLQDAEDLTSGVLETLGQEFWDNARAGTGWDPHGGKCLGEYFLGFCDLKFNNVFKKWERDREKGGTPSEELGETSSDLAEGYDDGDAEAAVTEIFPGERGMARIVLVAIAEGKRRAEIAKEIGMKPKALYNLIAGIKRRNRNGGKK